MPENAQNEIVIGQDNLGLQSEVQIPEAGHEGGFPPFNTETFEAQLVWLVITFGILYYLMSKVALPRIANVIEERRDRIADDLDQAGQFKAQTEDAIQSYETALAEARAKAHAIAQETRDRLSAETDLHREKLENELDKKIADAETRIAATKEAALAHVRGVATDVASSIVTQLLGEDADKAAVEKAVDAKLG
ncbi:H+transporting two-sector ATPase B/B' subunit [Tepidicaulis marinus]|jgi:F-type H+-transporting ATPase subunit b|uniref:ATP synthase subunit b n=1 Tax=Tepidicaulis marinus TaxID=1333998 RepID=A0A081BAH0_9HYPH|nr:F0F1 ATP synthase subunit B [Tepidicaulis marinus]GAK45038.1 H+transporting two-sector ATPase B/B' subunit [Tepidicaulis marinus]